jgi:hypothetical protein
VKNTLGMALNAVYVFGHLGQNSNILAIPDKVTKKRQTRLGQKKVSR